MKFFQIFLLKFNSLKVEIQKVIIISEEPIYDS
jgi:hypothetical protein